MSILIMNKDRLIWTEKERKKILDTKVFSVWESWCTAPCTESSKPSNEAKKAQVFTVLDAVDWAIIIPVIDTPSGKQFVMVWQWRHGARELSLEFPGGVFEPGEKPEEAAARELYEETGYYPGKIKKIGEASPNPAIMSNKVHFFLAEELEGKGVQNLDKDEYVEVVRINAEEVIQGMGKKPYIHALMGTAAALYQISVNETRKEKAPV